MDRCWRLCVKAAMILFILNSVCTARIRDDDDVLQRLSALEINQMSSKNDIKILRSTVGEQQEHINKQAMTIEDQQLQINKQAMTIENQQLQINKQVMTIENQQLQVNKQAELIAKLERELLYQKENVPVHANKDPAQKNVDVHDGKSTSRAKEFHQEKKVTLHKKLNTEQIKTKDESEIKHEESNSEHRQNCGKENGIVKRQVQGGIAFTAYLDHDVDPGNHQTIKFNRIITNEGNGYSIHTGAFTCPEGGVYMFSFEVGQRGQHQINAELVVNSVNVIDAVAEGVHDYHDVQGGNTVTIRLKQGDSVWIDVAGTGFHAEGSQAFRLTSFTGLYLYN